MGNGFFSYHLVEAGLAASSKLMLRPLHRANVPGLRYSEAMTIMTLGTPVLSPARMQTGNVAVFAEWDNEEALTSFLKNHPRGRLLDRGWHVRMNFLYRWGHLSALNHLPKDTGGLDDALPIVSVTLAKLKLSQTLRFTRWGKPVESFVRDHPGKRLALAAFRPLNTFSTFSIWETQADMKRMVFGSGTNSGGGSGGASGGAHAAAMKERNRKDFHHEFITLRFRAVSEHGRWQGNDALVPR